MAFNKAERFGTKCGAITVIKNTIATKQHKKNT